MTTKNKPLSPHLQVYKPQITSVLSITHRATGVFLCVGLLLLTCWLFAMADGPLAYANVQAFFTSLFGRLLLFAFSFSLFYHLLNGIRHLVWDSGNGLEIEQVIRSGWLVVMCSVLFTLFTWFVAYQLRG